ncbi:hypothetical protein AXG93_3016s1430 [Marchantia polymorpha subsp. ruderalis]|uniref:Uncharacterized protein n=1 Tax=Marchantia polymorpha subsp. ruderalis TaxID=1480154 RepID=A0A176WC45_MARPO|nr:hypothetical protein AXG93_3016s1430 [Marchantia polymorpha subsp. ruderalis]
MWTSGSLHRILLSSSRIRFNGDDNSEVRGFREGENSSEKGLQYFDSDPGPVERSSRFVYPPAARSSKCRSTFLSRVRLNPSSASGLGASCSETPSKPRKASSPSRISSADAPLRRWLLELGPFVVHPPFLFYLVRIGSEINTIILGSNFVLSAYDCPRREGVHIVHVSGAIAALWGLPPAASADRDAGPNESEYRTDCLDLSSVPHFLERQQDPVPDPTPDEEYARGLIHLGERDLLTPFADTGPHVGPKSFRELCFSPMMDGDQELGNWRIGELRNWRIRNLEIDG